MQVQKRSADEMVSMVMKDPKRLEALKANPLAALEDLREEAVKAVPPQPPAYIGDKLIYRMVVIALGWALFVAALGAVALVAVNKTVPDVLVALGSAAVGALAGLLAPSPTGR